MDERTLLIHGWSDSSRSFRGLKKFLAEHAGIDADLIYYADYQSREDNLTFHDVADGLNDRLKEAGFIDRDGNKLCDLNVIVHSTGGLVIRHWLWRYYQRDGNRLDRCPVRRLVMLAPANFGSPLAHRGKSFLGSLVKGRRELDDDFLETGREILSGLELGSPYQWWLAEHDLLVPEPAYRPEAIQTTVLVGVEDYPGLRSLVNKPGTDGTVVIAGTSLDTIKFTLDPTRPPADADGRLPYDWSYTQRPVEIAFGVLPGLDHGSIVSTFRKDRPEDTLLGRLLLQALRTSDTAPFEELRDDLRTITRDTYAAAEDEPRFQQFLIRAVDDQGEPVSDFAVEFLVRKTSKFDEGRWLRPVRISRREERLSREADRLITREFHRHQRDASHRRFLVDPAAVRELLGRAKEELRADAVISLRVHVPPIDRGIRYRTERLSEVAIASTSADDQASGFVPSFFFPNTTTLLEIRIDRENDYVEVSA
ncbi:MAG: alpha/beta hydrolase [Acidobacteriota bacterium]|jgi:pimeloyl-ACP methyl ester carboxylesterase